MDSSFHDRPLEGNVVNELMAFADQFELSVKTGHEVAAAMVAHSIAQLLKRFSPVALSNLSSEDIVLGDKLSFLKSPSRVTSSQDQAYLSTVQPAVARFKDALKAGDVEVAIRALLTTGILGRDDSPQAEIRKLELDLARSSGVRRLSFLPRITKLAFWCGDTDKATEYALEALNLEPAGDSSSEGDATHDGNMVLGLIALIRSDIAQSKMHLRNSVGSNMTCQLP